MYRHCMDFFVGSFFQWPTDHVLRREPRLERRSDAMSSVHGASDPTMIATVSEKSVLTTSVARSSGRKLPLWMQWRSFWAVSATWSRCFFLGWGIDDEMIRWILIIHFAAIHPGIWVVKHFPDFVSKASILAIVGVGVYNVSATDAFLRSHTRESVLYLARTRGVKPKLLGMGFSGHFWVMWTHHFLRHFDFRDSNGEYEIPEVPSWWWNEVFFSRVFVHLGLFFFEIPRRHALDLVRQIRTSMSALQALEAIIEIDECGSTMEHFETLAELLIRTYKGEGMKKWAQGIENWWNCLMKPWWNVGLMGWYYPGS